MNHTEICRNVLKTGLFAMALAFVSPAVSHAACDDAPAPGVDWKDCRKRNLIMSGSDLSDSDLSLANFASSDLRDSNFSNANLFKTNLLRASFEDSIGTNADFRQALGFRTNFSGVDFTGSNFEKAELHRSSFKEAILTGTNFEKTELGRADFTDATITGAVFKFSNLSRADFRDVVHEGPIPLEGAYLLLTRIEGVDLSGSEGLAQWQVDMACGDSDTKLPEGLTRPANWPCGEDS